MCKSNPSSASPLVLKIAIPAAILIALLFTQSAMAKPCEYDFTMENWLNSFDSSPAKQKAMLDMFSSCLANDPDAQERVDYLVVESLTLLQKLDKPIQKAFMDYNLKILLMNAQAGFASSQHNYASLHNANPASLEFKLVPQSQKTFIYWTKMAASQAEPRALFNLAVRYADTNPPAGLKYDPAMAYRLFLLLNRDYGENPNMGALLEYSKKEMERLKPILGEKTAHRIKKSLSSFDYGFLAPK